MWAVEAALQKRFTDAAWHLVSERFDQFRVIAFFF